MPRRLRWVLVAVLSVTTWFPAKILGAASHRLKVQVVSPTERIFPDTAVAEDEGARSLVLLAARNETRTFQIALHSAAYVTIRDIRVSNLVNHRNGAVISGKNFRIRIPGLVFLEKHTGHTPQDELVGTAPGWFPDPLLTVTVLRFRGTRSIYGTYYIPPGTKRGDYEGELRIHYGSRGTRVISVHLHVWGFDVPTSPSLYVTNWLYISQIESQYGIRFGTPRFWSVIAKIAADMSSHRQDVIFTPLSLIHSYSAKDGAYTFDFSDYDRWVDIFRRHGFRIIEGSHLFSRSSYDLRYRSDMGQRIPFGQRQLRTPKGRKFLEVLLRAVYAQNERLGIRGHYLQHVADEANRSQAGLYRKIAGIVHRTMPGVPVIDATQLPVSDRSGMMDIPVTLLGSPLGKDTRLGARWGKWWYTALNPRGRFPNRFIDYPLVKLRIIPWLSWRYGVSGYLHYGYNWWFTPSGKSPWKDVEQSGRYPPGDGFIVYPPLDGADASPVPSLRWEVFRDGMEDYEYLHLLSEWAGSMAGNTTCRGLAGQAGRLIGHIRSVVASTVDYPRRPDILSKLRIRIGDMLDQLATCRKG
jgi:hypothetical protein